MPSSARARVYANTGKMLYVMSRIHTGTCIRNLGRIGLKLSIPLNTQLVLSMILSHLDYYNAIFYNLPAFFERKLTKVLYAAVRFVCNTGMRL